MFDVVAVGELLIDFTPFEKEGKTAFEQNAGGAPPNLLAAVSRLGGKGAFIGKVGRDAFGRFLKKTLEDFRIDTSGLCSRMTRQRLHSSILRRTGSGILAFTAKTRRT